MVAARNTLAIALCVLPALAIAGLSEEPSLDTDGENVTCGTAAGNSVLQRRTTQLHGHSLNATEGGDQTTIETAPPFCGTGTWWKWSPGDGVGGRNILIGKSLSKEGCEEACAKEAWKGRGFTGCTYGYLKMECWAEENWQGAKALNGWITSKVPDSCRKVTITNVREDNNLEYDYNALFPCDFVDGRQITLYRGVGRVVASGPIEANVRTIDYQFGNGEEELLSCVRVATTICDNAKTGDYFFWPASVRLCRL